MKVIVFPGDLRQHFLAKELEKRGFDVKMLQNQKEKITNERKMSFLQCLKEELQQGDVIVLPTPSFLPDGKVRNDKTCTWELTFESLVEILLPGQLVYASVIGEKREEILRQHGIVIRDMMSMEEVAIRNAVATAEGAIAEAISMTTKNLQEMKALVIGFGRCGSVLAEKLKGLCKDVTVMARRREVLAQAEGLGFAGRTFEMNCIGEYGIIFNTVPSRILFGESLEELKNETVVIDLAGAPGGVDFEFCKKHGIRAKLCSGLPGIYAPETSGIILADAIERSIGCRD